MLSIMYISCFSNVNASHLLNFTTFEIKLFWQSKVNVTEPRNVYFFIFVMEILFVSHKNHRIIQMNKEIKITCIIIAICNRFVSMIWEHFRHNWLPKEYSTLYGNELNILNIKQFFNTTQYRMNSFWLYITFLRNSNQMK